MSFKRRIEELEEKYEALKQSVEKRQKSRRIVQFHEDVDTLQKLKADLLNARAAQSAENEKLEKLKVIHNKFDWYDLTIDGSTCYKNLTHDQLTKEVGDLLKDTDFNDCQISWHKHETQNHIRDRFVDELYALCQTRCMCCLTEGCKVYGMGQNGKWVVCRTCGLKYGGESDVSEAALLYNTTSGTYQEEEKTPFICSFANVEKEDYLTVFCRMLPDN